MRGVVDALAGEVEQAKAEADATAEKLAEAACGCFGVEVRDDLLPKLAQAKAAVARLTAELGAAKQFYNAPSLPPSVTKRIALPKAIDYQQPERVAPPVLEWKRKFIALVQGEGT